MPGVGGIGNQGFEPGVAAVQFGVVHMSGSDSEQGPVTNSLRRTFAAIELHLDAYESRCGLQNIDVCRTAWA